MLNRMIRVLVLAVAAAVLLYAPSKPSEARTGLDVGLYCIALGHQRLECHFEVTGGNGNYTYQFTPTATRVAADVGIAIIPCQYAYSNQYVYLNVSDTNGATGSAWTYEYCGDAD